MKTIHVPESWANPTQQNDILWRFISFDKFAAILETKSLYFSRTDQYEDPTEGLVPDKWNIEFYKKIPGYFSSNQPTSKLQTNFASCWYRGDYEPAQMWHLNPENKSGICIRTTQARLINCLETAPPPDIKIIELLIGAIKYIDYRQDSIPIPAVLGNPESHDSLRWSHFLKRKEFSHEQEFRILFLYIKHDSCPHLSQPIGMNLEINLNQLIDKVIVSPYVLPQLVEVVKKLLNAYDLNIKVEQSSLLKYK